MTDKPGNILVIEDNQEVLEGIMKILTYCGYSPEGVSRFSESIFERLKSERFDLIILDVMLSGTDGRDLAKRFKKTKEIREVPILMISAYQDLEISVKEAGADGFLRKPFGLSELRQKVEQYL